MDRFIKIIDWFMPEISRDDSDQYRQRQFVIGLMLALSLCCGFYWGIYAFAGHYLGGKLIIGVGLLWASLPFYIRGRGQVLVAVNIFFGTFLLLLTYFAATFGGLTAEGIAPLVWAYVIPMGAVMVAGARLGWFWGASSL